MQTIRLHGEWLICPLKEIKVIDFQCWRKNGRNKRKFSPYLHLQVGSHHVVFDGYDSVWSFLDTIQPNMYRTIVNSAMKGDIKEIPFFKYELDALIEESHLELITITIHSERITIPNSIKSLECYVAKDVVANEIIETDISKHNFVVKTYTPYRSKHGLEYVPTEIYGSHPQYAMLIHVDNTYITQSLVYNSDGADFRPIRTHATDDISFAKEILNDMIFRMTENEYPQNDLDNKDAIGMRYIERDSIEHERFIFALQN